MNSITNEKKQLNNYATAKERFMSLSKSLVVFISILGLISYYSFFENTTVIAKTKDKKYVTVTGKAVGIGSKETVKKDKKKEKEQEKKNTTLATKPKKDGKNYIVKLSNSSQTKYMEKHLDDSKEINANSENKLEKECMVNTTLTKKELNQLKNDTNIEYIEEDFIAKACTNSKNTNSNNVNRNNGNANNSIKGKMFHKKKENRIKKNTSKHEWNIQMINADKVKNCNKKSKACDELTNTTNNENADNKVKLAILDSGIDAGNDIDLAYQVSLVPGEEEMTQVFMDGNGHGSSVASLIGAKDNGEGITGINPNAKIYSYRVLDDENKAPVSRIVEAIYMAISQNVNIINMSFGLNEHSKALEEAIKDAKKAGILVICAAGNTGDKGVQYPAAFEETMAVGAVDKLGNVEDYSAKGEELEIVAPGELVRTTGFLGSEEVTSGTSLASPQVAAVASLIWQKDLSMPADFVRGLLDESANKYGEENEYGNGLVDAEYALDNYDSYKKAFKKYEENKKIDKDFDEPELEENEKEITTFEDTGCVEGSWSMSNHQSMISETKYNVRYGARYPDLEGNFKDIRKNAWWHGSFKHDNNYIGAAIYISLIANALGNGTKIGSVHVPGGLLTAGEIKNDIKSLDDKKWEDIRKAIGKDDKVTKGIKRAVVWGMAIHAATDIYAHSIWYNSEHITHDKNANNKEAADDVDYCRERYTNACNIAKSIMNNVYPDKSKALSCGYIITAASSYKYINLYDYIREVYGHSTAQGYIACSYSFSSK